MSELDRLDALRLRADTHPARFGAIYADALRRAGRLDEAIAVIRGTVGQAPRNVFGQVVLARCFRDMGHLEEAALVVRDAIALDATDPSLAELEYLLPFAPRVDAEDVFAASAPDREATSAEAPEREPSPAAIWEEEPEAEELATPAAAVEDLVESPSAAVPRPTPSLTPAPVFVTETMAELYVQQGFPSRAVAIYCELVARAPSDERVAKRLAEVVALAARDGAPGDASPREDAVEDTDEESDGDTPEPILEKPRESSVADAGEPTLEDLPWLEDVDPLPVTTVAAGPEVNDELPSAFDFSEDAHRVAPAEGPTDEALLASLSFDAISLPTAETTGVGIDLPEESGPSAREALGRLAARPVTVREGRPSAAPQVPRPTTRATTRATASQGNAARASRVGLTRPSEALGDDFDQWLRGVS